MAIRNYKNFVSATTLNGAVNDSTTSWTVANGSTYPATPFTARCETEIVLVTAKSGTNDVNWTVTRGYDGSTAASHSDATEVTDAVISDDMDLLWNMKADAGSAASPSISFEADTNTGFYRTTKDTYDTIGFSTAGAERAHLSWDSAWDSGEGNTRFSMEGHSITMRFYTGETNEQQYGYFQHTHTGTVGTTEQGHIVLQPAEFHATDSTTKPQLLMYGLSRDGNSGPQIQLKNNKLNSDVVLLELTGTQAKLEYSTDATTDVCGVSIATDYMYARWYGSANSWYGADFTDTYAVIRAQTAASDYARLSLDNTTDVYLESVNSTGDYGRLHIDYTDASVRLISYDATNLDTDLWIIGTGATPQHRFRIENTVIFTITDTVLDSNVDLELDGDTRYVYFDTEESGQAEKGYIKSTHTGTPTTTQKGTLQFYPPRFAAGTGNAWLNIDGQSEDTTARANASLRAQQDGGTVHTGVWVGADTTPYAYLYATDAGGESAFRVEIASGTPELILKTDGTKRVSVTNTQADFDVDILGAPGQISFGVEGSLTSGAGTQRWYAPHDLTIERATLALGTASSSGNVEVDINRNGTTIFTTQTNRPICAASSNFDASGTPDVTSMTQDTHYLTIDWDAIGTGAADATVTIYYKSA